MITYVVANFDEGIEDIVSVTELVAVFNSQHDASLFCPGGFLTEYTSREDVARAITRRTELSDILGFGVE